MKITNDIIETVKKTSENTLDEISNKENWAIRSDDGLKNKWNKILNGIEEIEYNDDINEMFIKLFSYLQTKNMLSFAMELRNKNPRVFNNIMKELENVKEEELEELTDLLKTKILVVYRLNIIPKIFSEDRVLALQNALRKF